METVSYTDFWQVLHLLRRYLGEYVEGLSVEALRISVWKGLYYDFALIPCVFSSFLPNSLILLHVTIMLVEIVSNLLTVHGTCTDIQCFRLYR